MADPSFAASDGVRITYTDVGEGPPVLLLHGFLVNAELNWHLTGMVDELVAAGFRVLAPDARGHGRSEHPHAPAAYANGRLALDVVELAAHAGLDDFVVVGYSMGADTAARAAPQLRLRGLVLGGVGGDLSDPLDVDPRAIAAAIRGDAGAGDHPLAEAARALPVDRIAAAALVEGLGHQAAPDCELSCPVLVVQGSDDDMAGGTAEDLAARFAQGRPEVIAGADHFTAPFQDHFRSVVVDFVTRTSAAKPLG